MKALTAKQERVLDVIRASYATRGLAPTVREIPAAVGVSSTCTVQRQIEALEKKGKLRRPRRYGYRNLELIGAQCLCGDPPALTDVAGRAWCRACAAVKLAEVAP